MNEECQPNDHYSIHMTTSIAALSAALAKAQGEIEGAKKDADNPFFHSRYADLASVWEACRTPLSKNALAIVQLPGTDAHGFFVDTILSHSSGEWISSRLYITPVKNDPQAIGSAITYARRYGLQAIIGIAPEDDDGEAAMGRQEERERKASPRKKTTDATPTPKVKADLAQRLQQDNIAFEEFMAQARAQGLLPQNKMTFGQMPEALAAQLSPHYNAILNFHE